MTEKPRRDNQRMNKWTIYECESCGAPSMINPGACVVCAVGAPMKSVEVVPAEGTVTVTEVAEWLSKHVGDAIAEIFAARFGGVEETEA